MKKIYITTLILSTLLLSACQTTTVKNAPDDLSKSQKATTSSQIMLNVKDPSATADQKVNIEVSDIKKIDPDQSNP
jgi:uncharacterized lipoprotein YajG